MLEKRVLGYLDSLAAAIDLLNIKGKISDDRAEYWINLVNDVKYPTQGLIKSNRADYREKGFLPKPAKKEE